VDGCFNKGGDVFGWGSWDASGGEGNVSGCGGCAEVGGCPKIRTKLIKNQKILNLRNEVVIVPVRENPKSYRPAEARETSNRIVPIFPNQSKSNIIIQLESSPADTKSADDTRFSQKKSVSCEYSRFVSFILLENSERTCFFVVRVHFFVIIQCH
jgi:hypothetical protein